MRHLINFVKGTPASMLAVAFLLAGLLSLNGALAVELNADEGFQECAWFCSTATQTCSEGCETAVSHCGGECPPAPPDCCGGPS